MEEMDITQFSVKPSASELAVEIVSAYFAWDSQPMTTGHPGASASRLHRPFCCRRNDTCSSKAVESGRRDDDDAEDGVNHVLPQQASLLHETTPAFDHASSNVLFDIDFTASKVAPHVILLTDYPCSVWTDFIICATILYLICNCLNA